jgi:hypothetical protein
LAAAEGMFWQGDAMPTDEKGSTTSLSEACPQEADGRRREPRYPRNDPAEFRVLSSDSGTLPATVLDISRSGLRVELPSPVAKGASVEVTLPKEVIIFGEVRYCRAAEGTYHAGISIQDVFYAQANETQGHLHNDQLSLYLARKGLVASELVEVQYHLTRCKLCSARYRAAVQLQERMGSGPA